MAEWIEEEDIALFKKEAKKGRLCYLTVLNNFVKVLRVAKYKESDDDDDEAEMVDFLDNKMGYCSLLGNTPEDYYIGDFKMYTKEKYND